MTQTPTQDEMNVLIVYIQWKLNEWQLRHLFGRKKEKKNFSNNVEKEVIHKRTHTQRLHGHVCNREKNKWGFVQGYVHRLGYSWGCLIGDTGEATGCLQFLAREPLPASPRVEGSRSQDRRRPQDCPCSLLSLVVVSHNSCRPAWLAGLSHPGRGDQWTVSMFILSPLPGLGLSQALCEGKEMYASLNSKQDALMWIYPCSNQSPWLQGSLSCISIRAIWYCFYLKTRMWPERWARQSLATTRVNVVLVLPVCSHWKTPFLTMSDILSGQGSCDRVVCSHSCFLSKGSSICPLSPSLPDKGAVRWPGEAREGR